MKGKATRKKRS